MAKTVINFRIDQEVKDQARAVAQELGVSLSTIINSQLRQLIRSRGFETNTQGNAANLESVLKDISEVAGSKRSRRPVSLSSNSIQAERLRYGYRQYTPMLTSHWDKLINWPERLAKQDNFYVDLLQKHQVSKVLDIACGTGFDSIHLLQNGFKVTSVDGSLSMLSKARLNAENSGLDLDARWCDWRRLKPVFKTGYDSVFCLGDSFGHLFEASDRLNVLKQIHSLLAPSGLLVIDQRNYDFWLAAKRSKVTDFLYSGQQSEPKLLSSSRNYLRSVYSVAGLNFNLDVYPLSYKELRGSLREAGFQVTSYGDFSSKFSQSQPQYFQHICIKR